MKRTIILAVCAIIAVAAVSCTKDVIDNGNGKMVFSVSSDTSGDIRTLLSGRDFLWEESDMIGIYDGVKVNGFSILPSSISADGKTASFAGEAAVADTYTVVAPFSSASFEPKDFSINIPSVQTVDADHNVDPSALVSVARCTADGNIALSNCFSLVKITINADNISAISLYGRSQEKIAGTAPLDSASLTTGVPSSSSATLKYDGGCFAKGDYYIVIYPTVFQNGFRLVLTDSDSKKGLKSSSKTKTFARNGGAVLGEVSNVASWFDGTIMNYGQLRTWADIAEDYASGETVKLGADIDCGGVIWTPAVRFDGIFDGQQHRIYNFTVQGDYGRIGFLGTLGAGAEISNVAFGSSDYDFSKGSAADAGTYDGTSAIISAKNDEPESWVYAAPVSYAEKGSTVRNVVNFMSVNSLAAIDSRFRLAGIVGLGKEKVVLENCVNYGNITAAASSITTSNKNLSIAGIVGAFDQTGAKATGCVNRGTVSNSCAKVNRMGGIIGINFGNTIESCTNFGAISNCNKAGMCAGGICGYTDTRACTFDLCSNSGSVTNDVKTTTVIALAGIVGYVSFGSVVKGCSNDAFVGSTTEIGNSYFGGIAGRIAEGGATITKSGDVHCVNSANLSQTVNFTKAINLGGIVGYISSEAGAALIEYADNGGEIGIGEAHTATTNLYVGGVVGNDVGKSLIRNCSCSNAITISSANNNSSVYAGGITGGKTSPAEITGCSVTDLVRVNQAKASDSMAGGVAAYFDPSAGVLSDCTLATQIWIPYSLAMSVGDIVGVCAANTSGNAITAFEGCRIGILPSSKYSTKKILACHATTLAAYAGIVAGKIDGESTDNLVFGSSSSPISIQTGSVIYQSNGSHTTNVTVTDTEAQEWVVGKTSNRAMMSANLVIED